MKRTTYEECKIANILTRVQNIFTGIKKSVAFFMTIVQVNPI